MKPTSKMAAVAAVAAVMALASCSSSTGSSPGSTAANSSDVQLEFALWNPTQLPVYQDCAAKFKEETGISVKVTQTAWNNYWANLLTQLAAGTAPDVFLDHVAYFPQIQGGGQLVDLGPYFEADGYDGYKKYVPDTNALWVVDGKRYALSADQDVEGVVYNTDLVSAAGMSADEVSNLTWNYTDGGSFEKAIQHLTVDKNGKRGDSPDFDKSQVRTYGFAMESGPGVTGQTQWSPFILSTGWTYTDKNPGGTKYNLNDPKMIGMWTWLQKMYSGGFIVPVQQMSSLGLQPVMDQNVAAMTIDGSWNAPQYSAAGNKAWAQLPSGPVGHPVTLTNSTGPSVTTSSKHPAEAAKWVEYIVSPTCANIVALSGQQIPVIPEAAALALKTLKDQGVETAYWEKLLATPEDLVYIPITTHGEEIKTLGNTAFDNTLATGAGLPEPTLTKLNSDVNALLAED